MPFAEPGGCVNFIADDDGRRVRDNYRARYMRLAEIKRLYDPGSQFLPEPEHSALNPMAATRTEVLQ